MTESYKTKESAKILIVDDVDTNRFILRDIIQEMGHTPVLTENGIQALKIVERLRPQLIILDVARAPVLPDYERKRGYKGYSHYFHIRFRRPVGRSGRLQSGRRRLYYETVYPGSGKSPSSASSETVLF